jgi:undecaprenyl pyrophosphate phosphatase UppP
MPLGLRLRFWLESVLGSITGILAIVTLFWHDWIEVVFGVDPDKGNGSAEWLVVVVLFVVTVTLAVGASVEWRRARLAEI